jgi:hypothetical protein
MAMRNSTRELTVIEEVLELHEHHPDARYVSQSEYNAIFNGRTQEQRIASRKLEDEAKENGEWWYKCGWCGQFVDGQLILSDVRLDSSWPAMLRDCAKTQEIVNRLNALVMEKGNVSIEPTV